MTDSELIQYAHRYANMYKGLIVNLMFSSREHGESRNFFSRRDAEDTLKILEIELNLFYDLLHTKVVVANSKLGKLVRCISFGLVVAALSLFHKEDKHGLKSFDVKLTYTLFFGVLSLDMVTHLLWMFSDWTVASCFNSTKCVLKILNALLHLKRLRWMKPDHRGEAIASTPIIFKRWSQTLPQFNFIEFCCQESGSESEFRIMIAKILEYMHIKDFIEQKKIDIVQMCNVTVKPLTQNLWQFIFKELLEKSRDADDLEEAKRIISARGEWVLENCDFIECSELMSYVKDVAYDESLLLWHIATELCYTDEQSHSWHYCDARNFSKCLSNYMIYLLYQQPSLMSEVSGISK